MTNRERLAQADTIDLIYELNLQNDSCPPPYRPAMLRDGGICPSGADSCSACWRGWLEAETRDDTGYHYRCIGCGATRPRYALYCSLCGKLMTRERDK